MDLKKIALGCSAGITLLAAAPAFADPQHWAPAHGWRAQHHQPRHYYRDYRTPAYYGYYQPRPVYVPPPVVYYAPPPPVVYYAPPRPVVYGTLPIGDARVRIGVQF